jgi:hypothetical protein
MSGKKFGISVVISGVDRITGVVGKVQRSIAKFHLDVVKRFRGMGQQLGLPEIGKAAGRVKGALGKLTGRISAVGGALGALGAIATGVGALIAKSLIGTAAEFERFRTVLGTIEGSSEKADAAMAWISDFAAKTPYELAQVTDNFVKLRAYGIDPMNGTLKTLGDTAAAMGKPLAQAVEAMADAITGENERLKEFGIKASKQGKRIVYEYTENGKTMRKAVNASNRAMIQSTLMGIWNSKYGGAMDKLSGTWEGMMSNLGDQWSRFKLMIMESGVFTWLSDKLSGLLNTIDGMAESGELQKLAKAIGEDLVTGLDALWETAKKLPGVWEEIKEATSPLVEVLKDLSDKFGAGNVAAAVLAGAFTLILVPALAATIGAFSALSVAMLTTPIGWIIGLVALLAYAVYQIYDNWEPVTEFFSTWWQAVKDAFSAGVDFISGIWDDIKKGFEEGFLKGMKAIWDNLSPTGFILRAFKELVPKLREAVAPLVDMLPAWAQKLIGGEATKVTVAGTRADVAPNVFGPAMFDPGAPGAPGAVVNGRSLPGGAHQAAASKAEVHVKVDLQGMPRGARAEADSKGSVQFELNQGFASSY